MKGKDLQVAVRESGIKLKDLVQRSGIKQRTIYTLYEKENVEQHYLEKLQNAGVNLQYVTPTKEKTTIDVEVLKLEVRHLTEKCDWLEEKADFYKKENERLEEEIRTFREQKTG